MIGLTERQAFDAMREFLTRHYRRTGADEIGGLLGDLEPLEDGHPADEASYEEWRDSIACVKARAAEQEAAE